MNDALLIRIADALDRLAPPPAACADLTTSPAYMWDGHAIQAVDAFTPVDYDLLTGIDAQKSALLENSRRLAAGHAAHDVLLWGARGTGKSAAVASVVGRLQREGQDIALLQCATDALASLPALFALLRGTDRPFILFLDDLGFDEGVGDARTLRSLLQGGTAARPAHVRLYVTSNRRHIVPRHLSEQDDPINPRDVVDDRMGCPTASASALASTRSTRTPMWRSSAVMRPSSAWHSTRWKRSNGRPSAAADQAASPGNMWSNWPGGTG